MKVFSKIVDLQNQLFEDRKNGKEIDINNIKLQDYAMYGPIRIGYFESEKYTEETIQEVEKV